jgi:hypothetical protein
MKKAFVLITAVSILAVFAVACGAPPPLKSDKYLNDTGLVATEDAACASPCFHGIIPGKTTFTDALSKVKADSAFTNVQSNDNPPGAGWSVAGSGEACCQMTANKDKSIVDALVVKVAPKMTLQQVIDKFGQPKYTFPVNYTAEEVAIAVIYPDKGIVAWVSPGNADSTVDGNAKVVIVLYFNPADWETKYLPTGELQAWAGFQPYKAYQTATPVITPRITPTP